MNKTVSSNRMKNSFGTFEQTTRCFMFCLSWLKIYIRVTGMEREWMYQENRQDQQFYQNLHNFLQVAELYREWKGDAKICCPCEMQKREDV